MLVALIETCKILRGDELCTNGFSGESGLRSGDRRDTHDEWRVFKGAEDLHVDFVKLATGC